VSIDPALTMGFIFVRFFGSAFSDTCKSARVTPGMQRFYATLPRYQVKNAGWAHLPTFCAGFIGN